MNIREYIERHKELHICLDELIADMMVCTGKRVNEITLMDLIEWSYTQTISPTKDEE